MLFWGLDNTLDTQSAYPCCPLSPRPFPMRAWLPENLLPWVFLCLDCWGQYWSGEQLYRTAQSFSLKSTWLFFLEKDTQKTRPALTECLAIQLCICFSKTKLHMTTCCHSFAIHPLAEFPSTPRKLCCTCFVMNFHKATMETNLNHSMCEYNTRKAWQQQGGLPG